jgi:hypothetical protein
MDVCDLVDRIRSDPAELVLEEPLRFRCRARSNPCDFNELLQALESSETIQTVNCESQLRLGISEDEWVILVDTLGSMRGIKNLRLSCRVGSRNFDPFRVVADAVNNAQSLRKLDIDMEYETLFRDPSGIAALANALREHSGLQEFTWNDFRSRLAAAQIPALDPVLLALPACPHLRKVAIMTKSATADAIKNLLRLQPAVELSLLLEMEKHSAVADEIRRGRCNIQKLTLKLYSDNISDATESVKALASAIQLDHNLECIHLHVVGHPTDEAFVALAEALTVNTTLRMIKLSNIVHGFQSYEAFAKMLLVNTSLVLELLPRNKDVRGGRRFESFGQMRIEQRLNRVGRGRLLTSSQTTKEDWVDALYNLSSDESDDEPEDLRLGCIFSLFRLNPEVVSMP